MERDPDITDRRLIEACQKGQKKAAELIALRFSDEVWKAIQKQYFRCGLQKHYDRMEDVFQTIMTELFVVGKVSKARDYSKVRPFIRAFAISRSLDSIRKWFKDDLRHMSLDELGDSDDCQSRQKHVTVLTSEVRDNAEKSILDEVMANCLKELSASEELIVRLVWLHGMKPGAISEHLSLEKTKVYGIVKRVRVKLKELFKQRGVRVW